MDCVHGIEAIKSDAKCIPIFTDEFGHGGSIGYLLSSESEEIASFLTFGTDESAFTSQRIPVRTHTEIVACELGRDNPDFLGALLHTPPGVGTLDMKHNKDIALLHLRFGTVVLEGSDCLIELDETAPPLPTKR